MPDNPLPTEQVAELRTLLAKRRFVDQEVAHELADLLHSIFDSLDNLSARLNGIETQLRDHDTAIDLRGRAVCELAEEHRGSRPECHCEPLPVIGGGPGNSHPKPPTVDHLRGPLPPKAKPITRLS